MKANHTALIAVFLGAIISTSCTKQVIEEVPVDQPPQELTKEDREAIAKELEQVTSDYNAAWEGPELSEQLESLSAFHSDDIHYYWDGTLVCTSQEEFEVHFERDILSTTKWYSAKAVDVKTRVLSERSGVVSFNYDGDIITPDGEKMNWDGALTYVFEKQGDEWRIVLIHDSLPMSVFE